MRTHTGRLVVIVIILAASAWVGWKALVLASGEAGRRGPVGPDRAVPVEVAPVESGLIRETRVLSGTLEASSRFVVASEVAGRIEHLAADLGDALERGQVIAELDDAEFVQAVAQAEAELAVRRAARDQAASTLDLATRAHERADALRQRGIASESEVDEAVATLKCSRAALAVAEAQVEQAAAALELARIRLGYTTVRAGWSGGCSRGSGSSCARRAPPRSSPGSARPPRRAGRRLRRGPLRRARPKVAVRRGIVEGERVQVLGEGVTGLVVVLGQQLLDDGTPVAIAGGPGS